MNSMAVRKNNLADFSPKCDIDLAYLIEQNRSIS